MVPWQKYRVRNQIPTFDRHKLGQWLSIGKSFLNPVAQGFLVYSPWANVQIFHKSIGYCSRAAPNKPDTFEDGKLGIVTRDNFKDNQNAVTPKRVTKRGSKIPERNGGL